MEWFLRQGNVVEGPLAEGQLREMLRSGALSRGSFVGPNRQEFRRITEWPTFANEGENSSGAAGPRGATAIAGTREPFIAESRSAPTGKSTALVGSPLAAAPSPSGDPIWPGHAQLEPDEENPGTANFAAPHAEAPKPDQGYFESVAEVVAPSTGHASFAFDVARPAEPSASPPPKALEASLPPLKTPGPAVRPVPLRSPPPVKRSFGWAQAPFAAAAISATVVLGTLAALAADRLLNGPASSNISSYLPAGASFYLEVPSVRRWARGLNQIEFLDSERYNSENLLHSLSETLEEGQPEIDPRSQLLASIDSLAVAVIDGERLFALHYESDEAISEYLTGLGEKAESTQWGQRYATQDHNECLWLAEDFVELCGPTKALERSIQVLDGRSPSAEEDAYLKAAKTRGFWSYLPFASVPALYAVGSQRLFENSPAFEHLSGATATAGLDEKGFVEKLDLLWAPGKAPHSFAPPGKLTLWHELPEGTLAYFNYRANFPKSRQEFETGISKVSLPPGAPTATELVDQFQQTLGLHPSDLSKGLGAEGLIALTFAPDQPLTEKQGAPPAGALLVLQTIDDHANLRRTLRALVEHLSEDRAALFWKDEHNLVGTGPGNVRLHLRLENGLFRLGIGGEKEVARIFGSPPRLTSDPAHEGGVADFDQELSALGWFDLGRAVSQTGLDAHLPEKEKEKLGNLRAALRLSGPARPVASWTVRQFESGDIRVRSRNFPTAFLLFALGGLGQSAADTMTAPDWHATTPADDRSPDSPAPQVIGPGPDGSFRLPPPQDLEEAP